MSKLLRANFARLWKSRIFWIGMVFTFGIGAISSLTQYREMMSIPDYHPHIDNILFTNCMFMPIVAAVFVGLFIGTEYSDGTIRNKLIVGQTRPAVYFSNFIVCTTALLMMHLTDIAVVVGIGFPLVGNIEMPIQSLLIFGLISMVTVVALSAIFLLMSMLIHNKASCSVAAIILSVVFLMSAMVINSRLNEPEYYDAYSVSFTDESGEMHDAYSEKTKNTNFLEGTKREVYEFLYDFLPGCQMLQIAAQNPENPVRLPLYSLFIIVVTSAFGVFFFCRKNLK